MGWLVLLIALIPFAVSADEITAARTLAAGTVLTEADLTVAATARVGLGIEAAVGKELRTAVYQGRPITAAHLTAPTLVGRNDLVLLAYERGPLRIETEGRALGAGGAGDMIRVMNIASRATVSARINPDGTVTVAQR